MEFLIYFVPGIIVLLGASAYYFFKERLVEKLLKILAISFFLVRLPVAVGLDDEYPLSFLIHCRQHPSS